MENCQAEKLLYFVAVAHHHTLSGNAEQLVGLHLSGLIVVIRSVKTCVLAAALLTTSLHNRTLKSTALAHQFHTSLAGPFSELWRTRFK